MNHLYHFGLMPGDLERLTAAEMDAVDAALAKMKKDAAKSG